MVWECSKTTSLAGKLLHVVASLAYIFVLARAAHAIDLREPYLPFAVAGGVFFYLRTRPKIREQIITMLFSLGFAFIVRFPHPQEWITKLSSGVCLLGFSSFALLGLQWIWSRGAARQHTMAVLAPAGALVFFVFSAQLAVNPVNLFNPSTYDLYLYAADGAFGFQPGFLFGRAMASDSSLRIMCLLVYFSLPLVMALACALSQPKKAEQPCWNLISVLMLAGLAGWALYNVLPATGPVYVFGASFPWHPLLYDSLQHLALSKVSVSGAVPRNAIPSLHMAWALLLYWNARRSPRGYKMFLAVYLGLTVMATLGTGEHYLVDLVTALPFALTVQAIVSPGDKPLLSRRALSIVYGVGLTLSWLFLVRYGVGLLLISPAVPWAFFALTCVVVWTLHARLYSPEVTSTDPSPVAFAGEQALGAHL